MRPRMATFALALVLGSGVAGGSAGQETESYGYDASGRLVSVTRADGNIISYVYDHAGNRVQVGTGGPPTAVNDTFTTPKNAVLTFNPRSNDTDPNGDTLTITAVGAPSPGAGAVTITSNGTQLQYTPATDFAGTATFTYTISDGNGNIATATVTVVVEGPPVASNDSRTTPINTNLTFDPRSNDSDPNGDALTITSVSSALHGSVAIAGGGTQVSYTPTTGYVGPDSFTYSISDGHSSPVSATVSVTVTATNQNPDAVSDSQTAQKDTALTFDPRTNDTDPESNALSITNTSTPAHGTLAIVSNGTQLRYTPATGYVGPDSFTYTLSDGQGGSDFATVSMFVNGPPAAGNDPQIAQKNTALTFDPRTNDTDPDGDSLTITAKTTPLHGTLSIGGGGISLIYTPTTNYVGPDSFGYTVADGRGGTADGAVTVSVNGPPVAATDTVTTSVNMPAEFDPRINDTDPENDTLTITDKTNGLNGTVTFTGTSVRYTPAASYTGGDTFTYTISDGRGGTAIGTVSMTISGNQAPVANDDSADANAYYAGGSWVYPSVTFNPRTNDTDPNGDTLTITGVTPPSSGTVSFSGTSVTYTYATQVHPTGVDSELIDNDSFTYTISDGHGGTATATVSISVIVW